MEAVIVCRQFSVPGAYVLDTRRCMPRSAKRLGVWRVYFVGGRVNISLLATEKGRGKVGWPFGVLCYSPLLHTSRWTEERKRMPRRGSWRTHGCERVRLLAGCCLDDCGIS